MSAIIQSNKEKEIKPFCGIHLSDIVSKGLIDEAKEYIKQYFFKVEEPQTIYYYNVSKADFIQKEYKQIFTGYLTDDLKYEERHNKKIVDKNLYWWFCNQEKTKYNLEIDIFKPRVYEENGQKYINLFRGFKYQDFKEDEQTEYIKESLTYIHTYMREVLCGSDDSSYKYLKNWTSHLMSGRKMKTCLYFKSTEGLGKSTFSDFLTAVMGDYNVYTTSSNSSLVHQFNGELKNIILVVYEELKCESMGEWARMNGALKNMITGKKIDIEPKGEQRINIANLISVIINSNESPIRLSSTDRRYCLFDISNCREGDYAYFGKLQKLMNDPIIQKAFFYDCKKHATDNQLFDEQAELRKLYTTTKAEELVRVMEAPLKFIKSEYVLKNKAFTPFLSELTEAFNLSRFADKGDVEPTYILKILRGIHIDPYKSTGGRYRFKVEHEQLLKIFTERKLMLEIDEFIGKDQNDKICKNDELQNLKDENEKLKKQLESYKRDDYYEFINEQIQKLNYSLKNIKENKEIINYHDEYIKTISPSVSPSNETKKKEVQFPRPSLVLNQNKLLTIDINNIMHKSIIDAF